MFIFTFNELGEEPECESTKFATASGAATELVRDVAFYEERDELFDVSFFNEVMSGLATGAYTYASKRGGVFWIYETPDVSGMSGE